MSPETFDGSAPAPLDDATFAHGLRVLLSGDMRLAGIHARHGPPPFWTRVPGFATLLHIILEQQVSLASALAAYRRVQALANPLTPCAFLALGDEELRAAGFSRQKTSYGRALAQAIRDGDLDLAALHTQPDDEVRNALTHVKGIGPWTADVYLLMALRRPDVWPVGDLALVSAVKEVLALSSRPGPEELRALSAPWRPWRAIATRLFWHHYLSAERTASGEAASRRPPPSQ